MGRFSDVFKPGSSHTDWCEPNYAVSANIAEFFNTVTSIPFIIFAGMLIYFFIQYGRHIDRTCHFVWAMMALVGVFSTYFHGNLSLAGQLLDQFSIMWLISAGVAVWLTRPERPMLVANPFWWKVIVATTTVFMTVVGCMYPAINDVTLFCMAVPLWYLMGKAATRIRKEGIFRHQRRIRFLWIVAFTFWLSDRFFCSSWLFLRLPIGHSIWHILVLYVGSNTIVIHAYMDTLDRYPSTRPVLTFWPRHDYQWIGIPYLKFEGKLPLTVIVDRQTNGNQVPSYASKNYNICSGNKTE